MSTKIISISSRLLFVAVLSLATVGLFAQTPRNGLTAREITSSSLQPENISANLDQCANGGVDRTPVQCAGLAWQNGNLGRNAAHYLEGESVPYRLKFDGLTASTSYTVTIEWDTTENSGAKHALDYLTDYDETETTADPCSDIAGCDFGSKTTFAIPMDMHVVMGSDQVLGTGDDVAQKAGVFTLFGGRITGVSTYTMNGDFAGASQTCITITIVPDLPNPVLAWGGHISTRMDWGLGSSAINISGSPYHMRLLDLNGTGGNQDRSLSSDAAIFPGSVTVVKTAAPVTTQLFGFTATGPGMSDFSLFDDGSGVGNSQGFTGLTQFGSDNSLTITESADTGQYLLGSIVCVESPAGGSGQQNSTVSLTGRYAHIILEEGEFVTCTFSNNLITAAAVSISGNISDGNGRPIMALVTLTNAFSGETFQARTSPFGYYTFDGVEPNHMYVITASAKGYTFLDNPRMLTVFDQLVDVNFVGGQPELASIDR